MFSPLVASPSAADDDEELGTTGGSTSSDGAGGSGQVLAKSLARQGQYVQMDHDEDDSHTTGPSVLPAGTARDGRQTSSTGLELPSLRSGAGNSGAGSSYGRSGISEPGGDSLSGSLISSEHPSEANAPTGVRGHHEEATSAVGVVPSASAAHGLLGRGLSGGFRDALNFDALSARLRFMLMEDASETQEEEVEMMDYDNPEDHILERKLDEDHRSALGGAGGGGGGSGDNSASGLPSGLSQPGSRMGSWGSRVAHSFTTRNWRKFKLTFLRMFITFVIGLCIGLTGFAVSKSVNFLIHANLHVLRDMMNKDRPAAAFFIILILACVYTAVAAFFVTFGSWQTRGSGVGRLNAYLSGMSSSRFLALKTLFVKVGGLILTVAAGIKQGMEGPFIHIGAMIGLHVSRLLIFLTNLIGSRCGVTKYTSIVAGVVDERMFISGGAAAGFSVAFNAPIAGVLYVQDGAFAYWQGEYTLRTFLCTMTAVTTLNLCFRQGEELPSRGLIDIDFARTTIVLQEFMGFLVLGVLGGLMGILFTKLNVAVEKLRHKWVGKARLPNVIDVLACTVITVLLSFILPFMLGCHSRWAEDSCDDPDRCLQFHCGPQRYSDLATFFFTLPEETIRILFDRKTSVEAAIPYQTLLIFCVFYFLMAAVSYGMAVPGGLFVPSIIIGASYGRLVGLVVQHALSSEAASAGGGTAGSGPLIIPGVYAMLGSASMLGGVTRMTLPISVMMIEVTSDSQFIIPIMLVVLLAKVVADFGCGALYPEHLKLDGLVMVFGDKPPSGLKKLTAKDIMSKHTLRKLDVVDSVENAWALVRDTRHHAFPVTDSALATLRTIIQKRRHSFAAAQQQAQTPPSGISRRRNSSGSIRGARLRSLSGDSSGDESKLPEVPPSSSPDPLSQVSSKGTGVFLGLIQRRHLIYVLTSMPCFPTATEARDSEPMTALPYELQLAQYAREQQARRARPSPSPEVPSTNGSDNGMEVVPLDPAARNTSGGSNGNGTSLSPLSISGSPVESPSGLSLIVDTPPLPPPAPSVSHALMHGAPLLNPDGGASTSASFVEWCARQATEVGADMGRVAAGDVEGPLSTSKRGANATFIAAAKTKTPVKQSRRGNTMRPSSSLDSLNNERAVPLVSVLPPDSVRGGASSLADAHLQHALATPHTVRHSSSSPGLGGGEQPPPLGADLSVQPSMLSHFVNLSPFIDQGAYTVSESISARRVWALFRALGMRHIVVLDHAHQPTGVITRGDLIRFAARSS